MTTTATAIREQLVTQISALVPTVLSAAGEDRFKRYRDALPFEIWAQDNAANCFRWFDLRFDQPRESPLTTNGDVERWRYPFELVVAYPRVHYKTADIPVLELDQVQDEDQRLLFKILRDELADAVWILDGATYERETIDEITYLRLGAVFEIHRLMT